MRTNSFSIKMSKKSNHELEKIFEDKSNYTEEAVQAVIRELEKRNLIEKTAVLYQDPEKEDKVTDLSVSKEVLDENESQFEELVQPVLYSKKAIQGFTIFFSTLFGAILLMSNLKEMNKPKARMQVLVFGIVYTVLSSFLLNYLPRMFFISIIFNLIGYAVLIEYFWNKNLGKNLEHKKKKIWKPLIISLLFTLIMLFILISNNEIPGMKL
jgi:hypothetical protein